MVGPQQRGAANPREQLKTQQATAIVGDLRKGTEISIVWSARSSFDHSEAAQIEPSACACPGRPVTRAQPARVAALTSACVDCPRCLVPLRHRRVRAPTTLRVTQSAAQIDQIYDRFVRLCGAQGAAHSGGYFARRSGIE